MDLIALVSTPIWSFLSSAVPFLLVLTVIIFVHEYGHFQVARWCGVGVDTFAVGFGKEICGTTDKHGTRWKLGWIPVGGYVKFEDDANAASMPSREVEEPEEQDAETSEPSEPSEEGVSRSETGFHSKPLPSRAAVVAAGPIANFILAIIIYSFAFMVYGAPVSLPIANEVQKGSAAEQAGVLPGDRFVDIDGHKMHKFADIQTRIWSNQGDPMAVTIDRNGETIVLQITPIKTETIDITGSKIEQRLLGIRSGKVSVQQVGFTESLGLAGEQTWRVITLTLNYVKGVIVGRESVKQLAGPLGMARTTGYVAAEGINALLQLAALLSVSIGLINLFPIPMLDGGHLMYYAIEAVRGKPLGPNAQEFGFKVGFAAVLALMIVATWNDIARFFS